MANAMAIATARPIGSRRITAARRTTKTHSSPWIMAPFVAVVRVRPTVSLR